MLLGYTVIQTRHRTCQRTCQRTRERTCVFTDTDFGIVNERTVDALTVLVCSILSDEFGIVEWMFGRLKLLGVAGPSDEDEDNSTGSASSRSSNDGTTRTHRQRQGSSSGHSRIRGTGNACGGTISDADRLAYENACFTRLTSFATILSELTQASLSTSSAEHLLKLMQYAFKVFTGT